MQDAWDRTARPLHALVLGLALLALSAALALHPGHDPNLIAFAGEDLDVPCTLQQVVGVPCWACGMTRAFVHGVRGDLGRAWAFNPAGLLLLALVATQVPVRALRIARPGLLPGGWRLELATLAGMLAIVLGVWLARLGGAWPLP